MTTDTVDRSAAAEQERVAEALRSAGAWLKLAAERLDAGDVDQAANMVRLGLYGAQSAAEKLEATS